MSLFNRIASSPRNTASNPPRVTRPKSDLREGIAAPLAALTFEGEAVLGVECSDPTIAAPLRDLMGQNWRQVPQLFCDKAADLAPHLEQLISEGEAFQAFSTGGGAGLLSFSGIISGLRARLIVTPAHAGEVALQEILRRGQKAEAQSQLLRAQLDSSPTAIFGLSDRSDPQPLNAAAQAMVGSSAGKAAVACLFPSAEDGPQQLLSPDGTALGWVRLTHVTAPDGTAFVHIEDIDQQTRVERALESFMTTLTETFAHLDSALAIFDRNRQLSLFNPALTDLFDLNPATLAARPSFREFLEGLRQRRMLPEQADYTQWRRRLSEAVECSGDVPFQEDWTLPSGQILRVTVRPHPRGALAFVFKDISGHVMLERRYRAEVELSQATLDRLHEAVAVFSASGQVLFTNEAFEQAVEYNAFDTVTNGGIEELVSAAAAKCSASTTWQDMQNYALSTDRQDRWSGLVEPKTGGYWLLRANALPDGSTMLAISTPTAANDVGPKLREGPTPAKIAAAGGG